MSDSLKFFTDGAAYDRSMGRWSQVAGAKFLDWLALPKGLCWLDVGCGNGAFSEVLMRRCSPSALHGIDASDAQLDYARTREATRAAEFRSGDAQALPYEDDSFDAATMALVISFIPDPAMAVSEMARVVKPGGYVASFMWDAPGGGLPYHPLVSAAQEMGFARSFRPPGWVYSFADSQDLWQGAGLESIETCRIDIRAIFSDFDDFWESSQLLASPHRKVVDDLPPVDRERIRAYLRDTLATDSVGRISVNAFATAVKGRVAG